MAKFSKISLVAVFILFILFLINTPQSLAAVVSGSLQTSKTQVKVGEQFSITVEGNTDDANRIRMTSLYLTYKNSGQAAGGFTCPIPPATSCKQNFSISESKAGTYSYAGYIYYDLFSGTTLIEP